MSDQIMETIGDPATRLSVLRTAIWPSLAFSELKSVARTRNCEIFDLVGTDPPLVAKTPLISADGDEIGLRARGDFIFRELDAIVRLSGNPFINRAEHVAVVLGVPAIVYRRRNDTARTLMAFPQIAGEFERLCFLHMTARGLAWAQTKGVITHQDLKPENVLVHYLVETFGDQNLPISIIPRINDFAMANAGMDRGKFGGFRPYDPAERYSAIPAATAFDRYDVYSLAIIAHELLTGGYHPMGIHMSEYCSGMRGPLRSEESWKAWARKGKRRGTPPPVRDQELARVLGEAFRPDGHDRPSMSDMSTAFIDAAKLADGARWESANATIQWLEQQHADLSEARDSFAKSASKILCERWPVKPNVGAII